MASSIIPCGGFEIDDDSLEFNGNVLKLKNTSTVDGFFIIHGELNVDSVSGDLVATIEEEFADIQSALEDGQIPVALMDNKATSAMTMFYLGAIDASGFIFSDLGYISDNVLHQTSLWVALDDEHTVCTVTENSIGGSSPENGGGTE